MMIQIFSGFPLLQDIETVLVRNIAKKGIAQAARFRLRLPDQGEKGLHDLQAFFRNDVHDNSYDDHCYHLCAMPTYLG